MNFPEPSVFNHSDKARDAEQLFDANGRLYRGWLATLASTVGMALGPNCILVFCFGSFVIPLQHEFGWGIGAISMGATVVSVMIVVLSLLAGYFADRVGGRALVLWSMPLFAVGVASLSRLPANVYAFYAWLFVVSLLGLGVWHISYSKLTAGWFDRRLGLSLGVMNAGIGIGAAFLPPLAGAVIAAHGWRTAYEVLGIVALAPWPLAWLMLKDADRVKSGAPIGAVNVSFGLGFRQAARTPEFAVIVAGFAILGATSATIVIHQVRLLVDSGLSLRNALAMQSVLGIALIAGRICTGWLLDRVRAALIMSTLCVAAAAAIALFAAGSPFGLAPVGAVVVGFVLGAELDVLGFLVRRFFGRRAFGSIYGAVYAVFQSAAAIAIVVVGVSRALLGSYALPLTVLAIALLVASLLFLRLRTYRFSAGENVDIELTADLKCSDVPAV